jgi:gliding motility-associated-like protein
MVVVILLILALSSKVSSQARPKQWHFGRNAAVSFFTGSPVVISGSNMNTPEGCASYTDGAGALLFYTNGVSIWGSNHNIIPNGTGLNGNALATQSALPLPKPGQANTVYLFTVDASAGPKGFCYSILGVAGMASMTPDKNIHIRSNVTEKLTSARHCNGKDFWVLVHDWNSDAFQAYLLNSNGLDSVPVSSPAGSFHGGNIANCDGYMKVSPKNDKLALAITGSGKVELFDFDNLSGQVTYKLTLSGYGDPYGVEFSPSGDRLYFSTASGSLYVVDLQDTTTQTIINSCTKIATSSSLLGALQRAPDNKIYVAKDLSLYLGVINNPNSFGTNANYVDNGLFLGSYRCEGGLPPSIPDAWMPLVTFIGKCLGDTFHFTLNDTLHIDSVLWNFGDPFSDSLNISKNFHPSHYYPMPGSYRVVVTYFYCDTLDSLVLHVPVMDDPRPYLGPDTSLCSADPFLLNPGMGYITYLWQNGASTPTLSAIDTGLYWVEVTNLCGTGRDSVRIKNIFISPTLFIINDTSFCEGDSIFVLIDTVGYKLAWHDMSIIPGRWFDTSGTYFAQITDTNGCKASDQFTLSQIPIPDIWLGNDTTICEGDMITLGVPPDFLNYLWSDGNSGNTNNISQASTVVLQVDNSCGSDSDTINIYLEDCTATLFMPNTFTPNGDGLNDEFKPGGQFIAVFEIRVFNRWGEMVFMSNDFNTGWNGRVEGADAPASAYAWTAYYKTAYGREGTLSGHVILLR